MILGLRASTETDPEREEKVHFACTCQNQSNFNHIRDSLGASLTGVFSPYTVRLVYDRMLAWMEPSSTYPDGQLALVVQVMGRFMLIFFFHRSLVAAQGKCYVGRPAETLQSKREISGFLHISPSIFSQPHPRRLLWHLRGWEADRGICHGSFSRLQGHTSFGFPPLFTPCLVDLNVHFQQKHQGQS